MKLTRIAATAALSGALALGGLGLGTGIAYADPGHGHGHGDGGWDDDDDHGDWRGPYYGPAYYGPPSACVNATGPFGYVSGSLCL
ncbi:hypothetical protein [Candidatus Mycolicibacterium alkanivorans]|uniref:Sulfur globule protein n=1 Tax=Candidatus Mycolicibacterium alkanivorans TaxID=2954114 RepID=A0ABS9YU52_9MYCO|nr:hypothetical protein [Candidatus Mycolicibacterium alkanivorans]MCI4674328.1 hypothetical protein [Candidatus Mycolicibacterium alkanivorans]